MIWVCTCNFALSIWSSYNVAFMAAANKYLKLTSLSPSNNASKSSCKLCYCKISFIVLVPGQGYRPPTVRIRWTTAGLWTALPERKRMWTARGKGWGSYRPQRPRFSSKTRKTRTLSVTEVNSNGAQKVWRLLDHCIIVLNINFQVEPLFSSSGDNDQVKN